MKALDLAKNNVPRADWFRARKNRGIGQAIRLKKIWHPRPASVENMFCKNRMKDISSRAEKTRVKTIPHHLWGERFRADYRILLDLNGSLREWSYSAESRGLSARGGISIFFWLSALSS